MAYPPLAVTVRGFCEATSLSRTTAYKLINEGRLQKLKIAGRTLITIASIEALIKGGAIAPDKDVG